MFYYFQNDPDMEYIMIDSTILRAHACASGGSIKKKQKSKDQEEVEEVLQAKFIWQLMHLEIL